MPTDHRSKTSVSALESGYPELVDWPDWNEFKAGILPGDELFEYEYLEVTMGFASGESGIVLVRDGQDVAILRLSATG